MSRRYQSDLLRFPGMRQPSTDFEAVRDDLQIPYLWFELDLSTARSIALNTAEIRNVKGNSLYIDQNSDVGNATIIYHDPATMTAKPGRMFAQPGFNAFVPFDQLIIENIAQPGKLLRVFYGVDIEFKPGNTNAVTISGTINVSEQGFTYGASYKAQNNLAALTPEMIVAPGANTNGMIVWKAQWSSWGAAIANAQNSFVAKASAPASAIDGDIIVGTDSASYSATAFASMGRLERPVRIAAGKGLYYISTVAEAAAGSLRSALYTLL